MDWVAPLKDAETIETMRKKLKEKEERCFIVFEMGIFTGMRMADILKLKAKDVVGKTRIFIKLDRTGNEKCFYLPDKLRKEIIEHAKDAQPESNFVTGSSEVLESSYIMKRIRKVGKELGVASIGTQTMRKTYGWHYYKKTGDIDSLVILYDHSSKAFTCRFLGLRIRENNKKVIRTPLANRQYRKELLEHGSGHKRIQRIIGELTKLNRELYNPGNPDTFYGAADNLLCEMEKQVSYVILMGKKRGL